MDRVKPTSRPELLRFLAIIYYTGIVKLPSKADYFLSNVGVLPAHHAIKLSRNRFEYIWRNVHTSFTANSPLDEGNDAADSDVEDLLEDDVVDEVDEDVDNEDDSDDEGVLDTPVPIWYESIKYFIYIM